MTTAFVLSGGLPGRFLADQDADGSCPHETTQWLRAGESYPRTDPGISLHRHSPIDLHAAA
jgi:hypothetical protein